MINLDGAINITGYELSPGKLDVHAPLERPEKCLILKAQGALLDSGRFIEIELKFSIPIVKGLIDVLPEILESAEFLGDAEWNN